MDLTGFTSRELHALHAGYNADALVTIAALDIMAPDLHELAAQPHRHAEFRVLNARYALLLAEAKASQAKGQEVYAEIARRCGMDAAGGTTGNGTRYCRTCGFTDCPGAETGDCSRWPARDTATEVSNA